MNLLLNGNLLLADLENHVLNANVFTKINSKSSAVEVEKLNNAYDTLEKITAALNKTINLSLFYVVTAHFEGDSPITEIIAVDNKNDVEPLFEKMLRKKTGLTSELYFDSISSLTDLLRSM